MSKYNTDVLYHHGIKGQKWGIRRYQNEDGTLTEAGKRRLGQISDNAKRVDFDPDTGKINPNSSRNAKAGIHDAVASDYRNASSAQNSASAAAQKASNLASRSARHKEEKIRKSMDLSKMSNKELQDAINRMNLERNYKNAVTENAASGRRYVSDVLATAGDVLAIGASAASIAVAIHTLKS